MLLSLVGVGHVGTLCRFSVTDATLIWSVPVWLCRHRSLERQCECAVALSKQ